MYQNPNALKWKPILQIPKLCQSGYSVMFHPKPTKQLNKKLISKGYYIYLHTCKIYNKYINKINILSLIPQGSCPPEV